MDQREGKHFTDESIEKLKQEFSETQRLNLELLDKRIDELYKSLTSNEEGSIKAIYGELLNEQSAIEKDPTKKNPILINHLKQDLVSAYTEHYENFFYITNSDLPKSFREFFNNNGIDLSKIAREILGSIGEFMGEDLPADKYKNKFRLSVWLEKIQTLRNTVKQLL